MELTCPTCGNSRTFLVKTLQMHVLRIERSRVEVAEEPRPSVLELLCDECDTPLDFDQIDESLRQEILLTLGTR